MAATAMAVTTPKRGFTAGAPEGAEKRFPIDAFNSMAARDKVKAVQTHHS